MLRYVGDSKNLRSRVRQHCNGNIESSALRKTIAKEMGFEIIKSIRPSGSRKISLKSDHYEQVVSDYIQSGNWRVITCPSGEYAREFQWYAIDLLRPHLNKYMQFWNTGSEDEFANLLVLLQNSSIIPFASTLEIAKLPGVYSLWHERSPAEFANDSYA